LSTHFTAIHYGPEEFGLFTLGVSLASTAAGLTEFGQTQMLQKDIANEPAREAHLVSSSWGLRLALAVLAFLAFSVLGVGLYGRQNPNTSLTIFACLTALPLLATSQTLSAHLLNHFRNRRLMELTVAQQIMNFGGVLLVIHLGLPIYWCAISASLTTFLQCVVLYIVVRQNLKVRPKIVRFEWPEKLRAAAPLGLSALLGSFYLRADVLIIGLLGETSQLGFYGIAISVSSFFLVLPGLLVRVFMPVISKRGEEGLRASIDMLGYAWMIGALSVVVIYLGAPTAIRIFAGSHFQASVLPLRILGLSVLSVIVGSCLSAFCVARGFHKRLGAITGMMLVLNVALNVVAIPIYGISGSAFATTLCEFTGLFFLVRMIRKNSGFRFRDLQRPLAALFAAAFSLVICLLFVGGSTQSFVSTGLVEVAAISIFTLAVTLLGGLPIGVVHFIFPGQHHSKSGLIARVLQHSDWTRDAGSAIAAELKGSS